MSDSERDTTDGSRIASEIIAGPAASAGRRFVAGVEVRAGNHVASKQE